MTRSNFCWSYLGCVAAFSAVLFTAVPATVQAADLGGAASTAASAVTNPLSSIFGEKGDLELKDSINYPDCFEYKESMSITFHDECVEEYYPYVFPVYKYKVEHTEPSVMIEAVFQPGGGVLQTESSLDSIPGQGGMAGGFLGGQGMQGSQSYVGNQNPNMPTLGRMPNVYFDAHVWGVGPLGFLEATKGGDSPVNNLASGNADPTTVTDAMPAGPSFGDAPVPGLVGESDKTALKSMICWLAEAENEEDGYWLPDPTSASRHLEFLALAPELYVRARLANWGSTWFNQAGSAQVSATNAGSFVDSFGDHSSFLMAAAGAVIGYAMTKDDPAYTCSAQQAVTQANAAAQENQAIVAENQDALNEGLAREATYLPAGYNQESVGYDTCPLTGVGHYLDDNNNIHYVNCDPQERVIKMNCSTGAAELIEDEDAPGRVTEWLNPKTNPCAGRQGQRFGTDQHLYVRAPSCVNRLSSFKQGGKYLACDSQSTTYASCGRTLSGTGSMPFPPPLNGVRPSSRKSGGYSLCTAPSGSRTVNQLREYNEQLAATMNGTADGTAAGMAEAQNQIDNQVAQQGADCSKSGGNNGLLGAAAGAAAGYGLGELMGNMDGSLGGITGAVDFGPLQSSIGGFTDGIKDQFSGVTDAVGGVTDGIGDAVNGTLGDITGGMGLGSLSNFTSSLGALTSLNASIGSMTNLATQLGIMPEALGAFISAFNQDKLIPLYVSEMDKENWRSESPGSKMARMASMNSVPLASSVVGFSKNLSQVNCGEVGVWGQLCPLRGMVETSGDNMPASGLAAWRAYHKALPKIPDRKRMIDRPTAFNLDYPHTSACYEVGEDPEAWESRRSDRGGGIFGGGGSGLFGGLASGLDGIVSGVAGSTGLGSLFGQAEDSRLETGVFVYTYWRETECEWQVCSTSGEVLEFESKK